jgi:hypothetical protein
VSYSMELWYWHTVNKAGNMVSSVWVGQRFPSCQLVGVELVRIRYLVNSSIGQDEGGRSSSEGREDELNKWKLHARYLVATT